MAEDLDGYSSYDAPFSYHNTSKFCTIAQTRQQFKDDSNYALESSYTRRQLKAAALLDKHENAIQHQVRTEEEKASAMRKTWKWKIFGVLVVTVATVCMSSYSYVKSTACKEIVIASLLGDYNRTVSGLEAMPHFISAKRCNRNPISAAAYNGNVQIMWHLLQTVFASEKEEPKKDNRFYDALELAIHHHRVHAVEVLLDFNVDPNGYGDDTPLMLASLEGCPGCAQLLMSRGANETMRHQGMHDITPMHVACMMRHRDVVAVLLRDERGAYLQPDVMCRRALAEIGEPYPSKAGNIGVVPDQGKARVRAEIVEYLDNWAKKIAQKESALTDLLA